MKSFQTRLLLPFYHSLFAGLLAVGCLYGLATGPLCAAERPNIVLITADNLGYGDLGCYGNQEMKTPHLDRLAEESVKCTSFYTASPTCTVSRATLLSGRYPQRIKLNHQLSAKQNLGVGLRQSELLIPHFLKKQGYATACFGKWNIGFAAGSRPTERGFDEFLGHASGNIDYYTHVYAGRNDLYRGTKAAEEEGYSTFLFADAACDFIRRNAKQPFFLYLPFNAPHFPSQRNKQPGVKSVWQAPDEYFALYGLSPDEQDEKKRYRAVVSAMDAGVGRVLKQIAAAGLRETTLVVFYSDNGAFMLEGRGLEVSTNKPLRDGGVTLWEGGIRVACLVRYPGKIEPATICSEPLISLDLLPMFVRASGGELPTGRILDGRDPTDALSGKASSPHEALFFQFRKYSAMRKGRFKLIRTNPKRPFELYDLASDLGETKNLAQEKPGLTRQLKQRYEQWFAEVSNSQ